MFYLDNLVDIYYAVMDHAMTTLYCTQRSDATGGLVVIIILVLESQ